MARTRLFDRVAKIAAKAATAADIVYDLTLHRNAAGSAAVDGAFAAGATTIAFKSLPAGITGLSPGATFKVGASAQTYTVTNSTTLTSGKVAGVTFTPALTSAPANGGSVQITVNASYPCQGLETEYGAYLITQGSVRSSDRKVLIFATTLQAGIIPAPGDRVSGLPRGGFATIVPGDTTGQRPVSQDPAGATWDLRCSG